MTHSKNVNTPRPRTLVAAFSLMALLVVPVQADELNPQPLPPSPGLALAMPTGPDTRVKMTEDYAKLVARDA